MDFLLTKAVALRCLTVQLLPADIRQGLEPAGLGPLPPEHCPEEEDHSCHRRT